MLLLGRLLLHLSTLLLPRRLLLLQASLLLRVRHFVSLLLKSRPLPLISYPLLLRPAAVALQLLTITPPFVSLLFLASRLLLLLVLPHGLLHLAYCLLPLPPPLLLPTWLLLRVARKPEARLF